MAIELYKETKNHIFTKIKQIINDIEQGILYNRKTLIHKLREDFNYFYADETDLDESIIDFLFEFDENGIAKNRLNSKIPIQPSNLELRWLHSMLEDKEYSFLLSARLHKKFRDKLKDVKPLIAYPYSFRKMQANTLDSHTRSILITYIQALKNKNQICYEDKGLSGILYQMKASPYCLEYDITKNNYTLILWDNKNSRVIRANASKLHNLKIMTDEVILDGISEKVEMFYKQHRTSFKLKLKNNTNAVERCFLLFSTYDKDAFAYNDDEKVSTLDTYELTIWYYDFDRQEIIEKILSLGSSVTVIEPMDLREEIIRILKKAYKNFKHTLAKN